jgi:hypothetical protein
MDQVAEELSTKLVGDALKQLYALLDWVTEDVRKFVQSWSVETWLKSIPWAIRYEACINVVGPYDAKGRIKSNTSLDQFLKTVQDRRDFVSCLFFSVASRRYKTSIIIVSAAFAGVKHGWKKRSFMIDGNEHVIVIRYNGMSGGRGHYEPVCRENDGTFQHDLQSDFVVQLMALPEYELLEADASTDWELAVFNNEKTIH